MVVRLSALRTGAAFTPRKCSWYSFLLEAESTPGPQCDRRDFMSMKHPLTSAGIESVTFRFVAQHLNHCATAVPPLWSCTVPVKVILTLSYLCKAKCVSFLKIWHISIYLDLSFRSTHCQFMSYVRELHVSALTMYKIIVTDDRYGWLYMLLVSWYERNKC